MMILANVRFVAALLVIAALMSVTACSGADLVAPAVSAPVAASDNFVLPMSAECTTPDTLAHAGIVYKVGVDSLGLPVGGNRPRACTSPINRPVFVAP